METEEKSEWERSCYNCSACTTWRFPLTREGCHLGPEASNSAKPVPLAKFRNSPNNCSFSCRLSSHSPRVILEMAGASDKARFYLEQSVPELREWERREIFSKVRQRAVAPLVFSTDCLSCRRRSVQSRQSDQTLSTYLMLEAPSPLTTRGMPNTK